MSSQKGPPRVGDRLRQPRRFFVFLFLCERRKGERRSKRKGLLGHDEVQVSVEEVQVSTNPPAPILAHQWTCTHSKGRVLEWFEGLGVNEDTSPFFGLRVSQTTLCRSHSPLDVSYSRPLPRRTPARGGRGGVGVGRCEEGVKEKERVKGNRINKKGFH